MIFYASAANKKKLAEPGKEIATTAEEKGEKEDTKEQPLGNEGEEEMLKELGDEEEEDEKGKVLPPGGVVVCSEGMATRIHRVIVKSILPQLHKCLTHKVGRRSSGCHGYGHTNVLICDIHLCCHNILEISQ